MQKNKRVLTTMILFVLVAATCMVVGCKAASDPEIKEETDNKEISTSETTKRPDRDLNSTDKKENDEINTEDTVASDQNEGSESVPDSSESEAKPSNDSDEWWPKYDSPEDVLNKYMESQDGSSDSDLGYLMYDVNADGYEELIITRQDHIADIYGNYKGKMHLAYSAYADYDVTLYPEGMLKETAPESAEAETTWQQYYTDFGDYLPVFQEMSGEYYTFCAYDLNENDMEEINRSLKDIGEYPVWLGEWLDMIPKKEYDSLVPKTKPVKLLKADALSDRSALEVKPETLLYVKASDGYANLRTGPGTEYEIICQIPNGDEMEMYLKNANSESGKKWLKVTYFTEADNEDGYSWLTGWIAESQLE